MGSSSRPQQKGSSVGTGRSQQASGLTGPASPRWSRGRQLPSVTLPVTAAHRHRVWGGPHLQAGEMHILYDAARAGHDLLLQEQAAQLQRRQPDLPVCGTHDGQPRTPLNSPWSDGSASRSADSSRPLTSSGDREGMPHANPFPSESQINVPIKTACA